MTKQDLILAQKEHLFPAVFHFFREPLVIERAKDQYVWDADGRQYLDFLGGIVSISVGHCNEQVNRRIKEQADKLVHVSPVFITEPQVRLAQKISEIAPFPNAKCFFTNSGTEANEMAILTARCYTGATDIIALRHSYHGRSSLAMAITGVGQWRLPGAAQPGVVHAHNAYCYRCPLGLEYPSCEVKCAQDMEDLICTTTSGQIAGVIAEPIQGVGGYITPPREYFRIVQGIVKKYGGLFISDEVQTAWGRTGGKWFGIEHYDVVPDIFVSAKGLANGLPIGVTAARHEAAAAVKGLTLSTFGGNPVTTTAARAVLDYIDEQNLRVNVAEVGAYLRATLEEMKRKHPLIGDVRGMGLLQAVELVRDRKTKEPATQEAVDLLEAVKDQGVLMGKGGLAGNVLRLSPPMNISKTDVDEFAGRFDRALVEYTAAVAK